MKYLQEEIRIRNLSENNLKDISFDILKRKLTVFTGVSGSGKSTIVFDTVGAEAQRQMNETYPAFVRAKLPHKTRPKADVIDNLTPVVVIDQSNLGGNIRSTVGTISDLYSSLRLLFARIGVPLLESSSCFSFNDPKGMCPTCSGLGDVTDINIDQLIDESRSLEEGAILDSSFAVGSWYWKLYINSGLFDKSKPIRKYSKEEFNLLLYGSKKKGEKKEHPKIEGVYNKFSKSYLNRDISKMSKSTQRKSKAFITKIKCPDCKGQRLNKKALSSKIKNYSIAELANMEVSDLYEIICSIKNNEVNNLIVDLKEKLRRLIDIGLPYISLDRQTNTLSGGEAQRVKIIKHLGSNLTNMTYIFDEPSAGMHPRDVAKINKLLFELRDKGNTVLVVEHDKDVISIADQIIDVGPHAGIFGGKIVFQGSYNKLLQQETLTAASLKENIEIKKEIRKPKNFLSIREANVNNLQNVSVDIPLGILTVITGVAGSGKSSLISQHLYEKYKKEVTLINQKAIAASSRSNPTTFLNFFDDIRKIFATKNKQDISLFSFNSKGACKDCGGKGIKVTELVFMDPVITLCETCNGSRYNAKAISYKLKGLSIVDILNLTVEEALNFFSDEKKIKQKLKTLKEVGLGYLSLGQPLHTLSGGERQRIKLAKNINKYNDIIILDEPTTGLHPIDIKDLMKLLNKLVDKGNSVIVIEHNLDVIKQADWIIDVGPDGGKNGGRVVFSGTPYKMYKEADTITANCLKNDYE